MKPHRLLLPFLLLAALLGSLPRTAAAQDINNSLPWWMSYASDTASLGDLTIPGSHDSGALYEPIAGTAKCQTLSILDQLNIGIRYLRGRIVLLRRFAGSFGVAGGIDVTGWRDNTSFTLTDTRGIQIVVQDSYQVAFGTNHNKWNAITGLLGQAAANRTGTLYLNFTSGVRSILGIPNVPSVSNDINNRLYNYFAAAPSGTHYGVVISDFVNRQTVQQQLRAYFH
jgi:hypothetical protein